MKITEKYRVRVVRYDLAASSSPEITCSGVFMPLPIFSANGNLAVRLAKVWQPSRIEVFILFKYIFISEATSLSSLRAFLDRLSESTKAYLYSWLLIKRW